MEPEVSSSITAWFGKEEPFGLLLPSGWFGRPHGNLHRVSFMAVREFWFILELDGRLLLTVHEPTIAETTAEGLRIGGFSRLVFDWREYAGTAMHSQEFPSGDVQFVTTPGA